MDVRQNNKFEDIQNLKVENGHDIEEPLDIDMEETSSKIKFVSYT